MKEIISVDSVSWSRIRVVHAGASLKIGEDLKVNPPL